MNQAMRTDGRKVAPSRAPVAPAMRVAASLRPPSYGLEMTDRRSSAAAASRGVTRPDDAAEREADRVAHLVTSMAEPLSAQGLAPSSILRDTGVGAVHRKCAACAAAPAATSAVVAGAIQSGRPLDAGARAFFESRFGFDFSSVHVHDGPAAARSARMLGASAYTVGHHIVFGAAQYQPSTSAGRKLLAHELTHVVQQAGGAALVRERPGGSISRTPIDLTKLDEELTAGGPLTQSSGEIGRGATRGSSTQANPPSDPALPITLEVFQATPPASEAPSTPGTTPAPGGSSAEPDAGPIEDPLDAGIRDADVPLPAGVPEPPAPPPAPAPAPAPPPAPRQRALVVGGIHGDERGPLDLVRQLQGELASATAPLRRDFHVLLIPIMNPGGVADRTRVNRRGVDLNRNFPGLSGFPAPTDPVPPRQPEVEAVMSVVQTLHPVRILALHAHGRVGGAYADPVEGPARELACRMALRMRGGALGAGAATDRNTRQNELANQVCNSRYPDVAEVSVTTAQSSLGAWASAPTSVGGQGIPVITHEVAGKSPLAATGARSVATIMPGIREFLLDNGGAPSEADDLLRRAVSDAFLTGRPATPAERDLIAAIRRTVRGRFDDLAAHYRAVWRPAQRAAHPGVRLPAALTPRSHVRSFDDQTRIMRGQLASLPRGSTDAQIEAAILTAMQTRSMPGFSRHHWGTEIDVIDPTRGRWTGTGDLVPVIPFLQHEAPRFGFFHPYRAGAFPSPAQRHYQDEPWHLSYWPIANVLAEEWRNRITGTVLANLLRDTAAAIRGRKIPQAQMERVLTAIGLTSFQTNVAPSP